MRLVGQVNVNHFLLINFTCRVSSRSTAVPNIDWRIARIHDAGTVYLNGFDFYLAVGFAQFIEPLIIFLSIDVFFQLRGIIFNLLQFLFTIEVQRHD